MYACIYISCLRLIKSFLFNPFGGSHIKFFSGIFAGQKEIRFDILFSIMLFKIEISRKFSTEK